MPDAIVVGSGPNGLTAAVTLAQAGIAVTVLEAEDQIGGGTRSSDLTLPGVLSDHCSAFHPTAAGSPALRSLGLEQFGLEWARPEIDLAHPLDAGACAVLDTSLEVTAGRLHADRERWVRLFGPAVAHFDALAEEVFLPPLHVPRRPYTYLRFASLATLPGAVLARRFRTPGAQALLGGLVAHSLRPLGEIGTSAIGLLLAAAGHVYGWPVARGGSRSITDALAARLVALGGSIETRTRVTALAELPDPDLVLLDTSPADALAIIGDRAPGRVRRAYSAYRRGAGVYKMDFAVEGGIPWANDDCRRAGTIHVGGSLDEIVFAEREVDRGRLPERPFVLVGQQYLADPGRSAGDVHPIWAYAHVPRGWEGDASSHLIAQIERFAPGFRDRVLATATATPADLASRNANFLGGDIATGANTFRQLVFRPRVAIDPYATGVDGIYLCSAATPPGAGVHGMCGYNAARSALRHLGVTPD